MTVPVKAGAHTVTFYAEYITPVVAYDETTLSAEFIPFDGNGHSPTNKAIHAALGDPAFTAKTDAAALNHRGRLAAGTIGWPGPRLNGSRPGRARRRASAR